MEKDLLLPPEEVAQAMLAHITRPEKYKSGTILKVCNVGGEDDWREAEYKGKAVENILQILGVEESALGNMCAFRGSVMS